jgi:adenine/guanine phosphoribosyltransferase-like PRPP-binding protein
MATPEPDDSTATVPTTFFWQRIDPASDWQGRLAPPWRHGVPVELPDGDVLRLPIRRLPSSADHAVASLIANQASFAVVDRLTAAMVALARPLGAEVVVGLPTLGMVFAPGVAQGLSHPRWVPLGYSRKFWYDEALSTPVSSITTPGAGKRLYLDPNQLPLLQGRRVLLVDDAVSSGQTALQAWRLLEGRGLQVAGLLVAMRQGDAWRATLGAPWSAQVHGVFDSPLLERRDDGWWPRPR